MSENSIACGFSGDRLMPVERAQAALLDQASCVGDVEEIALSDAAGRVLASSLTSPIDVPGFDNSAMDGYAIAFRPARTAPTQYEVTQRISAGSSGTRLAPGCAARIFTGAPVPPGADAVVMQEQVHDSGDFIRIEREVRAGENIRSRGNDIARNDMVLLAGQRLGPQHIGLAASIGRDRAPVYRRLRVGVFFTGDEIVEPGTPLEPGQIYGSNRYFIKAALAGLGCAVRDLGHVPDTLEASCEALETLAEHCDLLITTGGVSVGEEDYVRPAVERLGSLSLWRVAMKPGKPLAFGAVADTPFVGLPGNPVSAFVTFLLFAAPLIRKMQGRHDVLPQTFQVKSGFEWKKAKSRREFPRVRLDARGTEIVAKMYPRQGSDVLSSVAWADGLAEVIEGRAFSRGEWLRCMPFCSNLS